MAADEEFRIMIEKVSVRKIVWKRHQGVPEDDMLKTTFGMWHTYSKELRPRRIRNQRELALCQEGIQQWVLKRREAQDRKLRAQQDDERSLSPSSRSPHCSPSPSARGLRSPEQQLSAVMHGWMPELKPSPYYNLRYRDVLFESMATPDIAGPLLPLLADRRAKADGLKADL